MSETPSQKVQAKAAELLLTGKVKVQSLTWDDGMHDTYFEAHVEPSTPGDPYHVKYENYTWKCDCPSQVVCSHMLACQTIAPDFSKAKTDPEVEAMDIDALLNGL